MTNNHDNARYDIFNRFRPRYSYAPHDVRAVSNRQVHVLLMNTSCSRDTHSLINYDCTLSS